MRDVQFVRMSEDDDRQLLVDELNLTRNLAIVCAQQGKLGEAAELFAKVLELRRLTLVGQMSPVEVMACHRAPKTGHLEALQNRPL